MTSRDGKEFNWMKFGIVTGCVVFVPLVLAGLFRLLFVNFVDSYEIGYKFDSRTGKIEILQETGYYVTPPFVVSIHTVDLRPMQVCINANSRVLNCKLVEFKKEGLETFLAWHGRQDYDGGTADMHGGGGRLNEILKSYAFDGSGKNYPFLTVLRELKGDASAPAPSVPAEPSP